MLFSQLSLLTRGELTQLKKDHHIQFFLIDSRKAVMAEGACFFAIKGERNDGHDYVRSMYQAGIRLFVVSKALPWRDFPEASFFLTTSAIQTLQDVAASHRTGFNIPVVGITGSNAKTIIKEWIYQLLSPDFQIAKNPGSYNSQLGVPLSVLQLESFHTLAIFEAGISMVNEMAALGRIIQPTIGLFTNIGSSHDEGFRDRTEKIQEKLKLFSSSEVIIFCADHPDVNREIRLLGKKKLIGWGHAPLAEVPVKFDGSKLILQFAAQQHHFTLPFSETALKENLVHCIVLMLQLGLAAPVIQERINAIKSIPMRMELKEGLNHCIVIDDTYNNDLAGLRISLDMMASQQRPNKVVILSDILQTGQSAASLAIAIADMLAGADIREFHGVGTMLAANKAAFARLPWATFYPTTEEFISKFSDDQFRDAVILVKGARAFHFERITSRLGRKIHGTVMEIDLNALVHNLNYFRAKLKPGVKLMVMVKAFAYGSGSEEIAALLQFHKIDYLGVAYADEGVELRRNNVRLPIMVMNPTEESFATLQSHDLEPEIYSLKILRALIVFLQRKPCVIHLKIDSGMHRLGFEESDVSAALDLLKEHPEITVGTVFTHLAGSDEPQHDGFSKEQVQIFERLYGDISKKLGVRPTRHVLNSPGILRFPEFQFEMVRLGIGLHGVDPTGDQRSGLRPVATLKTMVSQIKTIARGQTIGYGRKGVAKKEMTLATIAIGYADGFSRMFSQGVGAVVIRGKRAPVVGNVCMDMTMVDITGIGAEEGDEVVIFGNELPIYEVASWINTIPYEILTNTSERVRRVFHAESI